MNIREIRSQFPVLKDWIYLDNAFVGLMPSSVVEGHLEYIESWHKFKTTEDNTILQDWLGKTNKVRNMVANLIKVNSREIAFTMNTGAGLNIVANGIEWRKGDNAVFPEWEHNPLYTHTIVKNGVEARAIKVKDGVVNISDLEDAIDDNTRLVQVSHVSYVNGFRFDLKEIVGIAHDHDAMVLVDATQAVGAIDVDYYKEKVDFVSIAPYKYLMGPTGLAFLYVREEKIPGLIPDRTGWKNQIWEGDNPEDLPDLDSAEKFEYGTLNFEGMYALERSLQFLNEVGLKKVERRAQSLSNYLYGQIMEIGKEMYTKEPPMSPIVSYFQKEAVKLAQGLKSKKIKITGRKAHGGHIRVSVHFYNTEDEIDHFIDEIK